MVDLEILLSQLESESKEQSLADIVLPKLLLVSLVIISAQAVLQICLAIYFYKKTRHIKEISRWLLFMVFLPCVTGVCYTVTRVYYYHGEMNGFVPGTASLLAKGAAVINLGQLIRMVRVQVQLRARKEQTKKIIKAIEKSKRVEHLVKFFLICY